MRQSLLLALISASACLMGRAAATEVSPISLRVEQVSNSDHEKFKQTQKRSLRIFLTNGSGQDQPVKVKYYYFSKGAKDKDPSVMTQGEKAATVKAHDTETVETPAATAVYTEKHREGVSLGNNRNRNLKPGKEVEASGDRIVGYGVRVFVNGKLAGETFSEPSLKASVGGGE